METSGATLLLSSWPGTPRRNPSGWWGSSTAVCDRQRLVLGLVRAQGRILGAQSCAVDARDAVRVWSGSQSKFFAVLGLHRGRDCPCDRTSRGARGCCDPAPAARRGGEGRADGRWTAGQQSAAATLRCRGGPGGGGRAGVSAPGRPQGRQRGSRSNAPLALISYSKCSNAVSHIPPNRPEVAAVMYLDNNSVYGYVTPDGVAHRLHGNGQELGFVGTDMPLESDIVIRAALAATL